MVSRDVTVFCRMMDIWHMAGLGALLCSHVPDTEPVMECAKTSQLYMVPGAVLLHVAAHEILDWIMKISFDDNVVFDRKSLQSSRKDLNLDAEQRMFEFVGSCQTFTGFFFC